MTRNLSADEITHVIATNSKNMLKISNYQNKSKERCSFRRDLSMAMSPYVHCLKKQQVSKFKRVHALLSCKIIRKLTRYFN